jgi:DNA-binding SARP family transcriptional activator
VPGRDVQADDELGAERRFARDVAPAAFTGEDLRAEAFEVQPNGLLVVDGSKRIVAYNAAAARLAGDHEALNDQRPGAACALLGCGGPDGQTAGMCLIEQARAAAGPLPEVLVDLPASASAPVAWITAVTMSRRDDHVVVQMRPGAPGDRGRSGVPSATALPKLRIVTLGLTRVESTAGPIGGAWLRQRPGVLLKYLVSQRRPVSAEEIAEQLWPDQGVRALRSVRYYVHALRKRLEPVDRPPSHSSFVLQEGGRYFLSSSCVVVDADEFEHLVSAGMRAAGGSDVHVALERLDRGLSLYHGDFLADEPYAEWAMAERDRLRSRAADALRLSAMLQARIGQEAGAIAQLERLAELEPFDDDVHRELIRLAMRRGRRSDAVRRYQSFRRRMLSTFGEEVDFSLHDMRG